MSLYHFTRISQNAKTGPIPVVTASKDTCPSDCPLMDKGCYANNGPLNIHWKRLDSKGLEFDQLLTHIRKLPKGTVWRYAQAGDLPNDPAQVVELAKASRATKMIVYTHKRDLELYKSLQSYNVFVNLSASTIEEADQLSKTDLPVTVVLPHEMGRQPGETLREYRNRVGGNLRFKTPSGRPVAVCPATYLETNCAMCQVCATPRVGGTIIGFPAHGSRKRSMDSVVGSYAWTRSFLRPSPTSVRI